MNLHRPDLEAPVWEATRTRTSTTLLFPQPGALLNLNHRTHWRTRARITRQWRLAAAQAALLLGPIDRRRRDPSNLTPLTKAAVDGLVDSGIWPDDTPEYVETLEPRLVHIPRTKGITPTIELVIVPRTGNTP
jgi:hypothetical protein